MLNMHCDDEERVFQTYQREESSINTLIVRCLLNYKSTVLGVLGIKTSIFTYCQIVY